MKIPILNTDTIEQLRGFFHPKDRSVILADDTFIEGEEVTTPANPRHNRGRLYWKNRCWTQLDEFGNETTFCSSWQNWTPTVNQGGAVASTVAYARYELRGDTVILWARLSITGAGVAANAILINGLPFAPDNTGTIDDVIGTGQLRDSSPLTFYGGNLVAAGANELRIVVSGSNSSLGLNPAVTLANGDRLSIHAVFERA